MDVLSGQGIYRTLTRSEGSRSWQDARTAARELTDDLADQATASTALPGTAPTHSINGTHYVNGGVRSGENADLASGYANVVVLSPLGGRTGPPPEGQSRVCAEKRDGEPTWQAR